MEQAGIHFSGLLFWNFNRMDPSIVLILNRVGRIEDFVPITR